MTKKNNNNNKCSTCDSETCSAKQPLPHEQQQAFEERQALTSRLCLIKHKIMVMSGKGGVGKSTVAANYALGLASQGYKVGLMDIDVHGPSIPTLFGVSHTAIKAVDNAISPIAVNDNLVIMSIGLWLDEPDQAIIWRGPRKLGMIRQFIKDVNWGELDFLIIDAPPGTGDEPLAAAQLIDDIDGAIIVTTPSKLSITDVQRSIGFCKQVNMTVLGIIENMSGFTCPHCHEHTDIFQKGAGEQLARKLAIPFLGRIPIDPEIVAASEQGRMYLDMYQETTSAKTITTMVISLAKALYKVDRNNDN